MENRNFLSSVKEYPSIVINNEKIIEANQPFEDLTCYSIEDIMHKSPSHIFSILKVGPNIDIQNIDEEADYFMFTKSLEVRFINIEVVKEVDKQIYVFKEKPNSRLEDKFCYVNQLLSENVIGVSIYSVPDFTLLKTNQVYLDFCDVPYNISENALGRSLYDFITGYKGSHAETMINNVYITGKSEYLKELKYDKFARGITYWDQIITPTKENGKVKYIVINTQEVTERVLNREKIQEQIETISLKNKQLEAIIENMTDGLFITDKDGKYTLLNSVARNMLHQPDFLEVLGDTLCTTKYFDEKSIMVFLDEMPSSRALRGEKVVNQRIMLKLPDREAAVSANATPVYDDNGNLTMTITCLHDITNYCFVQKLIEQQKEQLQLFAESMTDGLLLLDKNNKYTMLNKAAEDFFYKPESIKKNGDSLVHTKYFDIEGNELTIYDFPSTRVLRGEKVEQFFMKAVRPDKTVYYSFNGKPIYNEKGGIDYAVLCARNIGEKVKYEQELKEQKELLEAVIENMHDAISIFDMEGKTIISNAANRSMYSVIRPGSTLKTINNELKCYDLENNSIPIENYPSSRVFKGEKIRNERIKLKDSNDTSIVVEVNTIPIYNSENKMLYAVVSHHDISQIIGYEEKLRKQNEKLEAIISSMSDGLELVDKELNITFLNQSAKDFFYNPDAKVKAGDSVKFNKYYYGIDGEKIPREDLPAFRIFKKGSFQNYILTIDRPDKKIYASVNGSPIYSNDGTIKEAVLCLRNITEQVKLDTLLISQQDSVLQAEREKNEALEKAMEMKDEFLSLISHEFRTPINVINTAIQALNSIYADEMTDKVKEYIGTIRQNTFRQLRLVNNLLDITRANAGRIKIYKKNIDLVFLTKSITESVYQYASHKGVRVTFASTFAKKMIGIDDEKYERIVLNLLSNAIKFSPEGKSIAVNLRTIRGKICVEVKDNGIGIPPNKIDVIFERFGQVDSSLSRQAEGSGIGLSLVKKFVEALGGSISVKSKVGKGSTFTILLPNDTVVEEHDEKTMLDLMDNRLVQTTHVEFSDIYL